MWMNLRQSKLGCYICMGAFAYADDVALLVPTIMALNKLITACVSFAREYHVLFDLIKNKLIAFNCATTEDIYVTFDGEKIQGTFYLGNIVGDCNNEIRIKVTTDYFIRRANTVMSQLKLAPYSISINYLNRSVLFCSVLFCSVLFCSVLFCSVLFCSVLFCSVLFCSVLHSGICQQSRSISCIILGENACDNCINYLI